MMRASLVCLPLLLLLPALIGVSQQAASTTTLQSSSPTLQLPGSITLNATVTPPQATGGMPSGSVQFFTNGTHSIGTAALKALPATESFSTPPLSGTFGNQPYGFFTLPSGTSKYSILGLLDYTVYDPTTGTTYPELTIYTGRWPNLFLTPDVYPLTNSGISSSYPGIDAFATGDFNHDGITDVLIHGFNNSDTTSHGNEYYVLPGKADGTYDPTMSVISADTSGITCNCSNPTEAITVDDFSGDGYLDVAYTATASGSGGTVGVALNAGAASPGRFQTFTTAPAITPTVNGETFQSTAIASGHFTASGYPDLVVTGSPSTGADGYVALYLNRGPTHGVATFATPVLFDAGFQPDAIATADFRANGLTDVVVTNIVPGTQTGAVQVLFGDGKGHLATSSTVAVDVELASVSVADFNGDGYPDILAVGIDGSLNLLLNDGTGHFKSSLSINGAVGASLSAIGDFNADGLPDIAEITKFPQSEEDSTSTVLGLFNSASSQATLVTAAMTLPAGTDPLTAVFPSDVNFTASTSQSVSVTVTQTASALTWAKPGVMEYGIPLSATQLNAVSSVAGAITYVPAAGTVLPPGSTNVAATFVPTDTFDYTGASATQMITVAAPTMTGISPAGAELGTSTTITVNGQGLLKGAVVEWNGTTALNTTWVNLNQVTAVVPASLLIKPGPFTITVVDPNKIAVGGSQVFTVAAPTLAGISPTGAELGASTTIAVNGQGLLKGAVVEWNGTTALNTTWVSLNQVTAVVPASLLTKPGPFTITVVDPNNVAVAGSQAFTVAAPTMTGISPASAKLGQSVTIAVNGQGLLNGAVVEWNGTTALNTTWVSLNQLTAVVPASLLTIAGRFTISVVDPDKVTVAGSQVFTVVAAPATVTVSALATAEAGQNASVTLTVSPYPAPITATLTLAFTPDPPNTVTDPAVLFTNNTTTQTIPIPVSPTATITAVNFSTGSTAGTITLTIKLTAGGVDVTPASLIPVAVTVPAAPPVVNSVTLTRSGNDITIAILGLSSTRDMTQAEFHFTPASGASLKTTDLTVDLTAPFTTWYQSTSSDDFGTTFLYTQPFTLSSDAKSVGEVSVTLTNSKGASQPGTAQ